MKEVKYIIDHAPKILNQIKMQIGGDDRNGLYKNETENLSAQTLATQINDHSSCMISEFRSKSHLRVRRIASEIDDLLVLDFHVSEKVSLKLTSSNGPRNLIFGAYFASANIGSYADFGENQVYRQIAFIIDREWALQAFGNYASFKDFLKGTQDFFIYHGINLELASEIYALHNYAFDKENHLNDQFISGQSLKILSLFFASFRDSSEDSKYTSNRRDVEELLACREYMHKHFLEKLDLKTLVQQTSMSESKFRKQFKATFKKSPYEYVRHLKLWYAKELLENGESISQTAYTIGYVNLSYFTRNFQSTFGLTPSTYKKFLNK